MPPTAATRIPSTTNPANAPHASASTDPNGMHTRRTTSGRAVRATAARPANYYARPFGNNANAARDNEQDEGPPGFFPAITFFTDAITALPKEVMRQFTLMKEVEAKIWANGEKFEEVVNEVMGYPVPSKVAREQRDANRAEVGSAGSGELGGQVPGGLMSLTANNSVVGSTAASVVNGGNPAQLSTQNSVAGSFSGEEVGTQAADEEDLAKRQKYHELRTLIANMLPNLDEKGVVVSEANRILARQHMRIDSVMPFLEQEISEEARLGSMTHWAYSDNRQKKQATGPSANRRDVAATNSLAAAASAIHESDIAAARTVGAREGREKQKGKSREQLDSDFDDRPKKTHAKVAKGKPAGPAGLGISANGDPVKKRKVERGLAAPGMERITSTKGAKAAAKEVSRSTPSTEPAKKAKTKPAPLKRKGLASAQASPALASSPLNPTFTATNMEPPAGRAPGGRMRQSSNATKLRHEQVASDEGSRPISAPGKSNERKRKAPVDEADNAKKTTEASDGQARKGPSSTDADRSHPSRSGSNSGKAGRGSAAGTPRTEAFPDVSGAGALQRARSTRSMRGNREESESEPGAGVEDKPIKMLHKRQASNSHLVKQLASFNRSPDLDRHLDEDSDEDDHSDEAVERRRLRREKAAELREREGSSKSPRKKRPVSRRNTLNQGTASSPAPPGYEGEGNDDDTMMPDAQADNASVTSQREEDADPDTTVPDLEPPHPSSPPTATAPSSPRSSPTPEPLSPPQPTTTEQPDSPISRDDNAQDADDDEEGDPDDPDEPKYCYCDRGSYGEMIACDNEQCPREWFHLGCTGLREPPAEEEKWFCRVCAPIFLGQGRGSRGRGGRGRGRG
ncbi:uncharacterized protein LTR77_001372 [Saxophila tyrrhenica]|uniref:Chromatin modification-related protein n=1 Tax=Saxophila tyrrhenica TaxID=1690608 RepID=A0AAV9PPQ1_9PEZI|nr:hypothetical protein LTR77_001372 [Saxophila tyrrhenica]